MSENVKVNQTPQMKKLEEKAKTLSTRSGCYLMKNKFDQVIYVGKAKSLKNRVSSYFNLSAKNPKTQILVSHIVDFDFIVTENDAEAFVLENNLIKKFSPKYNIRLKDDKSYPYVVVNFKEPFPRLEYLRRVKREKGREVFGPFVSGSFVGEVLRILTKTFELRDCSLSEFQKRKEPCLLYQMKQCSAPCVGKISEEDYLASLEVALDLFRHKGLKTIKQMNEKMYQAAEREEFERAAMIRDQLVILENFLSQFRQENAEWGDDKDLDVIGIYSGEHETDISIYMIRNGLLLGHKNFNFSNLEFEGEVENSFTESALNFIFQYYSSTYDSLPDQVIADFGNEENAVLELGLETLKKGIKVKAPTKKYQKIFDLTKEHAYEQQRVRLLNQESVYESLSKLKDLIGMKERPVILECFDIAIFQGTSPTASQIVFHDGKPDKKAYRYYHLTPRPEGNNDFAMMKELIERRSDNGNLPDLFIVDGGIGQVNVFKAVLEEMKIEIPVIGIAKSKVIRTKEGFQSEEIKRSEERLVIPGRVNPYLLKNHKGLFRLITQMRDEAHRFSRKLHHHAEEKRILKN